MKQKLTLIAMTSFLFVAVFSLNRVAWSFHRHTARPIAQDRVFAQLRSDSEKVAAFCEIINDTDNPGYFYDSLIQGSGMVVYMNPEHCGPSPYSFTITGAHFYLHAPDEAYRWPVGLRINIRDTYQGNSCTQPGEIICSEDFSVPVDSAYPLMLTYDLSSHCCVEQPFFLEIIYTDPFDPDHRNPSLLMDIKTPYPDTCDNWMSWDGEYYEWWDFWVSPPPGDAIIRATGYIKTPDFNADGVIDIADAVFLINYVLKDGPPPVPEWTGDVNGDTIVDIEDVYYLINYLYRDGSPPCEP